MSMSLFGRSNQPQYAQGTRESRGDVTVVHVCDHIEPLRCSHVHDIRNTLQPGRVDGPARGPSHVVLRVGDYNCTLTKSSEQGTLLAQEPEPHTRKPDRLEARCLDIVQCRRLQARIVPRAFVRQGIERIANVPARLGRLDPTLGCEGFEACRGAVTAGELRRVVSTTSVDWAKTSTGTGCAKDSCAAAAASAAVIKALI
jgi:hypothetical protein